MKLFNDLKYILGILLLITILPILLIYQAAYINWERGKK